MVRTPVLPPQGTWVRSLVEELRFCKLDSMAKKKKKKKAPPILKEIKWKKAPKLCQKKKILREIGFTLLYVKVFVFYQYNKI